MRRSWTTKDLRFLQDNYKGMTATELSERLNRSYSAIKNKVNKLNLSKEPYTPFRKGGRPWNKGISHKPKGSEKGHFKKGRTPHNTREDGEMWLGVDHDKQYWMIKPEGSRHCEFYHRYRYAQLNGPVKEGMIVTFKDGNQMNIKDDNLICITRAENMKRNHSSRDKEMQVIRSAMSRTGRSIVDMVLQGWV